MILFLLIGGSFLFGMIAYLVAGDSAGSDWSVGSRVGMVTVDGPIISADDVVDELDRFRKNDSIKAVVLRIESPGGSVAASQEILEAAKKLSNKKPVIASMGSVAASGGYYIACGATKILANAGTVTGSIGVRMEHVMLGELFKWAKIQHQVLKSGKFKDLGSIDRPMTEEEKKILQDMLDDIHAQFKEEVSRSRNLEMAVVDEFADGRVFTGRQALERKLVDEIGGLSEAILLAGKMGGINGEPKVVYPSGRFHGLRKLFESVSAIMDGRFPAAFTGYWQPLMFMNLN